MTHTLPQFVPNGKEPNSVLQDLALKVVFSRVKLSGGEKEERESNHRETARLLLLLHDVAAKTD